MSLLDKASLIQIPSGYKNGKLYSVKPTPTFGSELVTNGDFDTDSDWNKGANWTITGGTANRTANATSNISQVISGISGKKIQVVFTVSNYGGSGGIGASANGNDYTQNVGNGTFTEQITPTSDNLYIRASYAFVGSIDNVSVKEITNIGDFDFSRASSATRVNAEGLIETAKVLGTTEEVTNGDFSSGGDWSGSASISSGQLTKTSGGLAYQDSVVTANKYYKVVVDVESLDGATQLYFGGNQYTLSVGVQTIEAVGGTSNSFVGFNNGYSSGSGSVFNSISVIEYIENDVPRLDYSDGSCASLLLEPQSTNLVADSEPTSGVGFQTGVVFQQTDVYDWNGVYYGDNTVRRIAFFPNTTIVGQTYTFSVFVKLTDGSTPSVGNSATDDFRMWNGAATTDSLTITDLGNGIFRCSVVNTATSTTTNVAIEKQTYNSAKTFEVSGYQLENLSYPTSYIPTNGSTATRTADVCNNAGTSATFNSTEGVLFAEIATLVENTGLGTNNKEISISDGTQNNRVSISLDTRYNRVGFLFSNNGSSVTKYYTVGDAIKNYNKYALRYKNGELVGYFNGVEVVSDFTITTPIANNLSKLAFLEGRQTKHFYGKTKQLMVFDEALSDAELSDLTGQVNTSFAQLAAYNNYTIL